MRSVLTENSSSPTVSFILVWFFGVSPAVIFFRVATLVELCDSILVELGAPEGGRRDLLVVEGALVELVGIEGVGVYVSIPSVPDFVL